MLCTLLICFIVICNLLSVSFDCTNCCLFGAGCDTAYVNESGLSSFIFYKRYSLLLRDIQPQSILKLNSFKNILIRSIIRKINDSYISTFIKALRALRIERFH